MITIYQNLSGNSSVRKVIAWCKSNGMPYEVRRIDREEERLTRSELMFILTQIEDIDQIISSHSAEAQEYLSQSDIDDWPLTRLLDHLIENPHILKGCILSDGKRVLTGYNSDDIRLFLSRPWRQAGFHLLEERF